MTKAKTRYPNLVPAVRARSKRSAAEAVRWLKKWGFDARLRASEPKTIFVEPELRNLASMVLCRDSRFEKV